MEIDRNHGDIDSLEDAHHPRLKGLHLAASSQSPLRKNTDNLTIAQGICAPLLRKIRADLQRNIEDEQEEPEEEDCVVNRLNPRYSSGVSSPGRHVRTRSVVASGLTP